MIQDFLFNMRMVNIIFWIVVPVVSHWLPNPGSELEGHRAPNPDWYLDLYQKAYTLMRKNNLSHLDHYNSVNGENTIMDYFYDLDGDHLDIPLHEQDRVHFVNEGNTVENIDTIKEIKTA